MLCALKHQPAKTKKQHILLTVAILSIICQIGVGLVALQRTHAKNIFAHVHGGMSDRVTFSQLSVARSSISVNGNFHLIIILFVSLLLFMSLNGSCTKGKGNKKGYYGLISKPAFLYSKVLFNI